MPIKRCTLPGGGRGWQYGNQKCYPTRQQALRQMRSIKYSQTHSELIAELKQMSPEERQEAISVWFEHDKYTGALLLETLNLKGESSVRKG